MKPQTAMVMIALAAFVLLFAGLGRADLFNPDEPREAEIAREMLVSGDATVPHLNGEPFLEKPPLFYWLVVPAFRMAGGPGELAARLVPALSGWLVALLVLTLGADLVGATAARLAAAILVTSPQFFWCARRCMIDMPLTLMVLVACLAMHRAVAPRERRGRLLWPGVAAGATGAAILMKGVVGAGIPALALIGFLLARRDRRSLVRLLPAGLLAFVPIALWVWRLHARLGAAGVREFVWVNNVLRFTGGAAKGHDQPFYYYLPTLLAEMAPWSLLLPFAVVAAWRARRQAGEAGGDRREPVLFLLVWFLLPFAALSLASTKRGIYLLPIYPAAALLIGRFIAAAVTTSPAIVDRDDRPSARVNGAALALLLAGSVLVTAILPAALRLARPDDRAGLLVSLALPPALALFGFRMLRAGRPDRLALGAAAALGTMTLVLAGAVIPDLVNGIASPRAAGRFLGRMAAARDRVALYRTREGALGGILFYAENTFPNLAAPEELRRHLEAGEAAGPGPRSIALMREEVYRADGPRLDIATTVVKRFGEAAPSTARAPGPAGLPLLADRSAEESLVVVAAEMPR